MYVLTEKSFKAHQYDSNLLGIKVIKFYLKSVFFTPEYKIYQLYSPKQYKYYYIKYICICNISIISEYFSIVLVCISCIFYRYPQNKNVNLEHLVMYAYKSISFFEYPKWIVSLFFDNVFSEEEIYE